MCGRFYIGKQMIIGLGFAMAPSKTSYYKNVSLLHNFINGNNDFSPLEKVNVN